ncbi:D-alanine--D-alanine ligase [Bacillus wiedmannii]|nr:D-alanine--D-alanine ligase [Bacillus sp. BB51/4]PHB56799.1 D-alanine--D-alanine ligase [Bacillus wiedmannii]PHB67718.1 D-alanine--D-alanine ligase [Bacillus wiedmannii]
MGLLLFYVLVKKWLVYSPIIFPLNDRVLSTRYRIHTNYAKFYKIVERTTGYEID